MKYLAILLLSTVITACSSQPKNQPSQQEQKQKFVEHTKCYAKLSQDDLNNLEKCTSLRLHLKGVNGAHGFRVFIGTEYPRLGLEDPFEEVHYVASISFYPRGVRNSNFILDVKPTLLVLIKDEGGLIKAGDIPIFLEPQTFHASDTLTPITVDKVEFELIR